MTATLNKSGVARAANPAAFPKDFAWGAATSAMQVEGSLLAGGGGKTIWEDYEAQPGKIADGSTNAIADDTYHRYPEDIALMRQMGLNAYRMSMYWTRILPEGCGRINQAGLDYYDRLIDALLAAGLAPWVTVYHFDYPQALQQKGGWMHPDSPQWLADYAQLVTARYSDRVRHWLTINEPNIFWSFGNEAGRMPPEQKLSQAELATGAHHILLGHGLSVQAIRAAAKQRVTVGIPVAGQMSLPASENAADIEAARRETFSAAGVKVFPDLPKLTFLSNAWWTDPVYLGRYPEGAVRMIPAVEKLATPDAMRTIAQPIDQCAVNLYFAPRVKAGRNGEAIDVPYPKDFPRSRYDWAITPEVLYWGPKFLFERYGKPVVITENGTSLDDKPGVDGKVHDPRRVDFLNSYLGQLRRAVRGGVGVQGYFHWSLLDNWEFSQGYIQQFGLIYVDRATQRRIAKDSAQRYREIIAANGENL